MNNIVNEEDIKCNTIEEVISLWEPMHKIDSVNPIDLGDYVACAAYGVASEMTDSERLMFILIESDYDVDEANKLAQRLDKHSKFAEYLHMKFLGSLENIATLFNVVCKDD